MYSSVCGNTKGNESRNENRNGIGKAPGTRNGKENGKGQSIKVNISDFVLGKRIRSFVRDILLRLSVRILLGRLVVSLTPELVYC